MRKALGKIINAYKDKEYKIKTVHKIFGVNEMNCVINGIIDDEDKIGIVTHGKELYCYKTNGRDVIVEEKNMIIIADDMMKIFISF